MDEPPLMDDLAVAAYECALRKGVFYDEEIAEELGVDLGKIAEARAELERFCLVSRAAPGRAAVPLDPEAAEAELVTPLELSIARRRREIAGIHRQLRSLSQVYRSSERGRRPADAWIRVLADPDDVRREIDLIRRHCVEERLSLQPGGGRPPELLDQDLSQTLEMRNRGIRIRTLYQQTARASLATRTYVRQICEAGAEVRIAEELAERLIIYDRKVAFIPTERKGKEAPGAAIVTEPTLVAYLCRYFESVWQGSQPYEAGPRPEQNQVSEGLRNSILRLMAMGCKDEVIARRLGMAARTCRRHISVIMEELGATSRFQAGLMIGRQGLISDDAVNDVMNGITDDLEDHIDDDDVTDC